MTAPASQPPAGLSFPSHNVSIALALGRAGHYVFPCHAGGENVKKPLGITSWKSESTNDASRIVQFWTRHPGAAVGLDLAKSNLIVIDADRHGASDGVEAFGDLMAANGFDPVGVPMVATPNSGTHYYFRQPAGKVYGNGRGSLPKGIDVRGSGGYVLAPGTILEDGREYEAFGDPANAFEIPAWLQAVLDGATATAPALAAAPAPVAPVQYVPHSDARIRAYCDAALAGEGERVARAMVGERNHSLNQAAFALGQLCGAGWLSNSFVEAHLTAAALGIGLRQPEISKTIRSGIRAGAAKPRQIADLPDDPSAVLQAEELLRNMTASVLHRDSDVPNKRGCLVHVGDPSLAYEPPDEIVRNTIPAVGVGFLGGQSGAYKSFLALELCFSVMTGSAFAGRKVEKTGAALFIAFEGVGTIAGRVAARRQSLPDPDVSLPFYMLSGFGPVAKATDFLALRTAIFDAASEIAASSGSSLRIIILDTVAASGMIGEDKENDPAAWQKVFDFFNPLSKELNAPVVLVHHYGKSAEAGLRGSSNARAGADFVLAMTCERNEITGKSTGHFLGLTKSRTGIEGGICAVSAEQVNIGLRPDGSPVTSLVLNFDHTTEPVSKRKISKAVSTLINAFSTALADHGEKVHVHGELNAVAVQAVRIEHVQAAFQKLYVTGGEDAKKRADTQRKQFSNALKSLPASIVAGAWNDSEWLWNVTVGKSE